MNKLLLSCLFIGTTLMLNAQRAQVNIKGKVTDGASALKGVNIQVANTENGTVTDVDGNYNINVEEGTTLRYTHVGYAAVEIIVEDMDRTLNIVLLPEANQLDNVTVTKTKPRKTQKELFNEYNSNPNLIKTNFGILDKETVGYSLRILDQKDINQGAIGLHDALQGRFAGVTIGCNRATNLLTVMMRGVNSLGGTNSAPKGTAIINAPSDNIMFEVDGVLFEELPCSLIDPSNVRRIAVIPSLSALVKYGQAGRGGVVIINTKSGNFSPGANGVENDDQAKVKNNIYENDALNISHRKMSLPVYLKLMLDAENIQLARDIYKEQFKTYKNSFQFVLDSYNHFANVRNDLKVADMVIRENRQLLLYNPVALKALAYLYQADGRLVEANELYKEIFILRPNYVQSYLDMANSYREIGEYQKAAGIYARYGYLLEQGFLRKAEEASMLMKRDLNNLVALKGRELLDRRDRKKLVQDDEFKGTRLVFEWNDSEAEFELQFVNPEGNYYKSEYSLFADAERIKNNKMAGIGSEEYLIDDSLQGVWQVNAKYLGNKQLGATYLKATIYRDYGSVMQRKLTKVFKLNLENVNQELFKLMISPTLTFNK